jgi:uncharacterized phage protein (TIGR02218 family)
MKATSTALNALLFDANENTQPQVNFADLYTITLVGGQVYRYTSGDGDITFGGAVYLSRDVQIKRNAVHAMLGLQVGTIELDISPNSDATGAGANEILGIPVLQAIAEGTLDGANVLVQRGFMAIGTYGAPVSPLVWIFEGPLTEVTKVGKTGATVTVSGLPYLLNTQIPNALYQPGCRHTLFDGGCTLTRASFATASAAMAGSSVAAIVTSLAQPDGYFAQGVIVFTSGANDGLSRGIATHAGGVLTLSIGLPVIPSVGDTFTVYPGCDKTQATCASSKFSNLIHFGGQPYTPVPETII